MRAITVGNGAVRSATTTTRSRPRGTQRDSDAARLVYDLVFDARCQPCELAMNVIRGDGASVVEHDELTHSDETPLMRAPGRSGKL
jgi:hypothetical protein